MIAWFLQRIQSPRFTRLHFCLAISLMICLPMPHAVAATQEPFSFTVTPIVTGNGSANDVAALRKVISNFWQAYLQLNEVMRKYRQD
jgi:hypothetical protein